MFVVISKWEHLRLTNKCYKELQWMIPHDNIPDMIMRTHPKLIALINKHKNTSQLQKYISCSFSIIEVPDDHKYYIDYVYGYETLIEEHHEWTGHSGYGESFNI